MPAKKKPRWTTAQKNAAAKKKAAAKAPKKPYHRGQAPTEAPRGKDRWRDREDAPAGERPKRVRRDGTEDRGQRTWERREDRGEAVGHGLLSAGREGTPRSHDAARGWGTGTERPHDTR